MAYYQVFKAVHIIFMVSWFAGLFYIWRLFIYHTEANSRDEPARSILMNQFGIMEKRLWYIITWPACIITLASGTTMLVVQPYLLSLPWMQIKLFFIALLLVYQLFGHRVFRMVQAGDFQLSSFRLRLLNEVATVLLIAIVFLVMLRDSISWIWGVAGIAGLASLLAFAVGRYRKARRK